MRARAPERLLTGTVTRSASTFATSEPAAASHPSSCQNATPGRSVAAARRATTRRSRDWRSAGATRPTGGHPHSGTLGHRKLVWLRDRPCPDTGRPRVDSRLLPHGWLGGRARAHARRTQPARPDPSSSCSRCSPTGCVTADRRASRGFREDGRPSCLGDPAKARCPDSRRGGCRGGAALTHRVKIGNGCPQHREVSRRARPCVLVGSLPCQLASRSARSRCRDPSCGAAVHRGLHIPVRAQPWLRTGDLEGLRAASHCA